MFMNAFDLIFDWLLGAGLRASILVMPVLGLQYVLRKWLPASWRYAMWLPVVLVLVLPVLPERPWSFSFGLVAPEEPVVMTVVPVAAPAGGVLVAPPAAVVPPASPPSARAIISWVWLTGAVVAMLAVCGSYWRILRRFGRTGGAAVEPALQAMIESEARRMRLRHTPRVCWLPRGHSPAVAGWWRPLLLLPKSFPEGFATDEARLIIRHELMHVRRWDLPMNWLLCALQCLHWFNPLLWLAFARIRADRELACDAAVLGAETADQRCAYGHALLKLQDSMPLSVAGLALIGIFSRGSAIKGRIMRIAAFEPAKRVRHALAGLLLGLLTFVGVTRAQPPSVPAASPAPHSVRPHIVITARIVETPGPLAANGQVLPDSAFNDVVKKAAAEKGMDLLSAPRVTTKVGMPATVEVITAREPGLAGKNHEERFLGASLELQPEMDQENFSLTASAKIGRGADADAKEGSIDWSRVRMSTAKTSARLSEGQWLVLDVGETRPGRHATIFFQAEAVDPVTGKRASFNALYPAEAKPVSAREGKSNEVFFTAHLFEVPADSAPPGPMLDSLLKSSAGSSIIAAKPMQPTLTAALSEKDFQRFMNEMLQHKSLGMHSVTPSGISVASGSDALVTLDTLRPPVDIRLRPALGPDGHTLDLEIRHPSDLSNPKSPTCATTITMWNKQAVLLQGEVAGTGDGKRHFAGIVITAAFEEPEFIADPQVPYMVIQRKAKSIVIPKARFNNALVTEVIDYLRTKGRELDTEEQDPHRKGVNIVLDAKGQKLDTLISMDLTQVSLWECVLQTAKLADLTVATHSSGLVLAASVRAGSEEGKTATGPMAAKARQLVIPVMELRGASIEEAVDFVREKSRSLDPAKQGVNVTLKADKKKASISLSLRDVPAWEALRYIAMAGELKMEVTDQIITLMPMND